jgi:hypothetical protein
MPLYAATPKPPTAVFVGGGPYALFDGTEAPALGLASRAFARGTSGGQPPNGTFAMTGCPQSATVDIQCSSTDPATDPEGTTFTTIYTITPDANGSGVYQDTGQSQFYRAVLSAYSSGTMPMVAFNR